MFYKRRQKCKVCEGRITLDYKKPQELKQYMNRLAKILPMKATRLCAKHQRQVTVEINRARKLALLPYVGEPKTISETLGRRRRRR